MRHKALVGSTLILLGLVVVTATLVARPDSIQPAYGATGCGDLDGSGAVNTTDVILQSDHYNPTGDPAPIKQVDQNKDGIVDLPNDILGVIQQFNHNCR